MLTVGPVLGMGEVPLFVPGSGAWPASGRLWSSSTWSSVPEVSLYLIRIVFYSSDIVNSVNIYNIILVVICDNIIVLVMTLS